MCNVCNDRYDKTGTIRCICGSEQYHECSMLFVCDACRHIVNTTHPEEGEPCPDCGRLVHALFAKELTSNLAKSVCSDCLDQQRHLDPTAGSGFFLRQVIGRKS